MNIRILLFAIAAFCFHSNLSAQPNTAKPDNSFTEEDWNKLSQHQKDSINKQLFEKYKEGTETVQKTEEAEVNRILDEALKNVSGTTKLAFTSFPKIQLSNDLTKFKNLEEFTCLRCKSLDLNTLFDQLAQLPKLKKLNLPGGEYKTMPNSIKKLKVLEEINLKDNNFTTLPDSFSLLKKLRVLNLEHNAYLYDDDVYDRIQFLNVEELNFSASGLSELNNKIGNLKSLKQLDISVNDIKTFPPSFNQLIHLQKLNLNKNLNMDLVPVITALAQIPTITELNAQECSIGNLPLDISKLTNLKILNLKGNRLTTLPINFGSLTNLEYLDLGYFEMGSRMNKIADLGPTFGQLKKLKYLNLAGNALQVVPDLSAMSELEELNLSLNKLPGFPQSITQLKKLRSLDLSLNDMASIPSGISNLTAVETLHLDGNFFNHPDKKIKTLPNEICQLQNLKVLTLKDNVIEQLPDCIGSLSKLEKLDLRDNLLTVFPPSFTQLKNLKSLDLKANDITQLPDDFTNLGSLKDLNLSMNLKMSFDTEKPKFVKMQQLTVLDLGYNNIPKDQIVALRNAMPNCKVINYDYKK